MFLRKNSGIEKKKETHLRQFPQKNKPPTKHKIVPRAFLHILVYVLEWKCLLCTRVEVKDTLYRLGSC